MSRYTQLLDSTLMLMLFQGRTMYGRRHVEGCSIAVIPFYPSNALCIGVPTSGGGTRLMTPAETGAYHETLPCWTVCRDLEPFTYGDGVSRPEHVVRPCTARCEAVAALIERSAVELGMTVKTLRDLAGRRAKRREYLSDGGDRVVRVGNGSGARPGKHRGSHTH